MYKLIINNARGKRFMEEESSPISIEYEIDGFNYYVKDGVLSFSGNRINEQFLFSEVYAQEILDQFEGGEVSCEHKYSFLGLKWGGLRSYLTQGWHTKKIRTKVKIQTNNFAILIID